MIVALAGGVGGARMAAGLAACLPPGNLTVIVNTGDDFEHLGLAISPDIDSVLYTMGEINDAARGWGQAGETWAFMDAIRTLGGPDWFALGDRDLATHVLRTLRLRDSSLSEVTADFARQLGITQTILPMSDDPVRSVVLTDEGELAFQEYFVHRQARPAYRGLRLEGAETARPAPGVLEAIDAAEAIILCPSNPWLSIAPIRIVPGIEAHVQAAARDRGCPVVAVSPFIGGQAVKGPAAKIMRELGLEPTPAALAGLYEGFATALVIDRQDAAQAPDGWPVHATDTLMRDAAGQARLGREVLDFARALAAA